jgi:hypothetical protein
MTNARHASFRAGDRSEYLAQYMLSAIGIANPILRQEDIGHDFHCLLSTQERGLLNFDSPFTVQIKSDMHPLEYGGVTEQGIWKEYEIDWLLNQKVPLYIGVIDKASQTLSLYSSAAVLCSYWESKPNKPFKLLLVPRGLKDDSEIQKPTKVQSGDASGDGFEYRVDLGNPLIHVSQLDIDSSEINQTVKALLRKAIRTEMRSILFRDYSQPFVNWCRRIRTNQSYDAGYVSYTPSESKHLIESSMPTLMAIALALKAHDPVQYENMKKISGIFVKEKMPIEIREKLADFFE